METRFRRYLTRRRLSAERGPGGQAVDELGSYSMPYETTAGPGTAPPVVARPLRRSALAAHRRTAEFDGLALRAISYDSLLPGKPPVLGGRPYKGNGPVKLQTSRRLSSGELLTTTQDNQRTLDDLRDGDYIVGRKEKRYSQLSQVKTASPLLAGPASPPFRASAWATTPRPSSLPEPGRRQPPSPASGGQRDGAASPALATAGRDSPPGTPRLLPTELFPPDSGYGTGPGLSEPLAASATQAPRTRTRGPSTTASLLTKGEEQSATIQALWKAEYGRLVAMYGQDGVDRNIAELNRDHRRFPSLEATDASLDLLRQSPIMLHPLPKPSFDAGGTATSVRHSQGSVVRDSSTFDEASDYSSHKPPSLLSSEGSSSSYTRRTSLYEPDLLTTREDVRRVVEGMRSNYLQAIESTARAPEKAKAKRRPVVRASLPYAPAAGASPPPMKPPKPARQSWHGSHAQVLAKAERKKARSKPLAPRPPGTMLKTSTSRSSVKSKASLQRADSLTLGALVPRLASSERRAWSESAPAIPTPPPALHAAVTSGTREAADVIWMSQEPIGAAP